jgi:hypothetical protein
MLTTTLSRYIAIREKRTFLGTYEPNVTDNLSVFFNFRGADVKNNTSTLLFLWSTTLQFSSATLFLLQNGCKFVPVTNTTP